jgi:acyl carrier protein
MESVLARVRNAFHSAFETDPQMVTLDTVPEDISGWNSMGHLTLVSSLEEEFHVNFDVDDLMAMENVREIVRILEAKLGAK